MLVGVGLDCIFHTYLCVQVTMLNDLQETLDLSLSMALGLLETPAHATPMCDEPPASISKVDS